MESLTFYLYGHNATDCIHICHDERMAQDKVILTGQQQQKKPLTGNVV